MATAVNTRPGTKAHARMVRMSASKARVVLNLVRGKHVNEAMEILSFSERLASEVIGKCLASAVANAEHNDGLDADELFVSACYADQGPTLKRFRPRARGRAGRIHKQTCHITVEVSRYTEEELDRMRVSAELKSEGRQSRSTTKSEGGDRAKRVAKSQAAAADEVVEEVEEEIVEADEVTEEVTDAAEDTTEAAEVTAEAAEDSAEAAEDVADAAEDATEEATDEVVAEEDPATDDGENQ